jgi:hypothetical protein
MAANVTTGPSGAEGKAASDAGRLLADAVHEWARARFGDTDSAHIATGAPECAWCPICQLIAALRGDRPDVTDKLAAAATAVVDVVGSLLNPPPGRTSGPAEDPTRTGPDAGSGKARPTELPTAQSSPRRSSGRRRSAGPRVQRIDLDHGAASDADR